MNRVVKVLRWIYEKVTRRYSVPLVLREGPNTHVFDVYIKRKYNRVEIMRGDRLYYEGYPVFLVQGRSVVYDLSNQSVLSIYLDVISESTEVL